ncbi:MAG: alanine racemase [Spirochaetes bacterium]|nr:MAG: alanine racemase [Spirochaetota bacterium]
MKLIIETYQNRPTRAEVSLSRLRHNMETVRALTGPGVQVMAMVKANAYGHGIKEVSDIFLAAGASCLGVAYLEEAVYLRRSGTTAPILVCGAINTDQIADFLEHDIEITSSSLDKSRAIAEVAARRGKTARVQMKIDTGMERIGVHWYNAERFIQGTLDLPDISVTGVFSHLAKAESDRAFTDTQIARFANTANYMAQRNILPPLVHLANSAGILSYPDAHLTMVRPGIMLYGCDPYGYAPEREYAGRRILPAMTLKTKVSYFKVVPAGTGISYNHTYVTSEQTRVVTLPVGYGDGYARLLSNRSEVVIRGRRCPAAGTICMDQMMVDIGPGGTAYNGDDVLLFGEMDGCMIPIEELCDKTGTIPYEMLCGISMRVPRVYVP